MAAVEAYGNIAANFNVLPLILANGNYIALIKQYIRRHKHRIRKKPGVDIVRMLGALVLKLGHAVKLAHIRCAVEHPTQLAMLLNVRLNEYNAFLGVYAASKQQRRERKGVFPKHVRILLNGYCMKIGYAVITEPAFPLKQRPIAQRAHIIANRGYAGRLNTAQYYFLSVFHSLVLLR